MVELSTYHHPTSVAWLLSDSLSDARDLGVIPVDLCPMETTNADVSQMLQCGDVLRAILTI